MRNKVLFYTSNLRAFRSTLIGHLYEICREFSVILLSEELDEETKDILGNSKLFPNLEEIVPVYQHTGPRRNLIDLNRYLCRTADASISQYRPDVVVASSDWHSLFEMYLMRFAKRSRCLRVTFQDTFTAEMNKTSLYCDLISADLRTPPFLPFWLRIRLVQLRKYIAHGLYYWLLPLTVFQPVFSGRSSYLLHIGHSGSRDAQFHIVFTQRDYRICSENGVPPEKLVILPHPYLRESRCVYDRLTEDTKRGGLQARKMVLVLLPIFEGICFQRDGLGIVDREKRAAGQMRVMQLITRTLPSWEIVIKPHPLVRNIQEIKERFSKISNRIYVAEPKEHAEKYIARANVIMELPRAASTCLFLASLLHAEKPIIALDFYNELLGDCYKDVPGIHYIQDEITLASALKQVARNEYCKPDSHLISRCTAVSNACTLLNDLLAMKSKTPAIPGATAEKHTC